MLPNSLKNKIVETLHEVHPDKIILFGSYAYGKPKEESDIDLLVIKNNIPEEKVRDYRVQIKKLLWQQFKYKNIYFDVLTDSEERISHRIQIGDRFYEEIYNKGIVIYA